jgi:hypothetical protein
MLLMLFVAPVLMASCGQASKAISSAKTRPGILTGTAQACGGLLYVPTAHLSVYRVSGIPLESGLPGSGNRHLGPGQQQLISSAELVATQRVPTGSLYRFVLEPGHYFLTNTGRFEPPLGQSAFVKANRITHLDVNGNYCS